MVKLEGFQRQLMGHCGKRMLDYMGLWPQPEILMTLLNIFWQDQNIMYNLDIPLDIYEVSKKALLKDVYVSCCKDLAWKIACKKLDLIQANMKTHCTHTAKA